MNWSKWLRQTHRWFSVVFTVAITVNIVAIAMKRYATWVGLLAVVPLAFLWLTGIYLYALPYVRRSRGGQRGE
jgi:hypothetical protein